MHRLVHGVMHVAVNMVGARRWCSVVLMLDHRRQCRHRLASRGGVPCLRLFSMMIDCYSLHCLIFPINNFASLGAIII